MKKLLPILLATSLLLSACSIDFSSDFELQERCSEHAKNLFHERGYTNEYSQFSNNYSKEYNKCFILIETVESSNGVLIQKELFDAVQQKKYGYYLNSFSDGNSVLNECYVKNINTNIDSTCGTKEGFLELLKPFLEN